MTTFVLVTLIGAIGPSLTGSSAFMLAESTNNDSILDFFEQLALAKVDPSSKPFVGKNPVCNTSMEVLDNHVCHVSDDVLPLIRRHFKVLFQPTYR